MFIVIACAGLALLHLYLWRRLIRDTVGPGRARLVATVALVVLALVMILALALGTRTDPEVAQWFAWPGYLWLGMVFYLVLLLAVLEIPRLALRRWVRRGDAEVQPDQRPGVSRRVALARGSAALAGVVSTGLVGYGSTVALGGPSVKQVRIPLRRLDPRVAGLRIALVSDMHLGPLLGRDFTRQVVRTVNAQRPDLIALVGDLVDGSVDHLAEAAAPLRDLRSRYGTFFVTGNHEYYAGYEQWVEYVRTLGIRPLRNERVSIEHGGGTIDLAGVNDATAGQWQDAPDVGAALAGRDADRAVVLLAHQPVSVDESVAHGVDLQLSGHTHGGQLSPFEIAVALQQGTVAGLSEVDGTKLYVTSGAGFWGPPVRIGADPDITIVELTTED